MYKDSRYINAGTNEIYRWGHKAMERVKECLTPHNGYYSIPVDGGKYWSIGTSNGKYGEFCRFGDNFFSVNFGGFAYAKEGTEKGEKFIEAINWMINFIEDLRGGKRKEEDDLEDEE